MPWSQLELPNIFACANANNAGYCHPLAPTRCRAHCHPLQPSEPRQLSFQGRLLIQAGIAARIDSLSNVYICFPCPEVLTWQQVDPKPPRRHAVQTSTLQPRTPYSHICTYVYTYGVELDLCLYVSWERSDHKGKYAWLKLEAAQKFHVLKA